MLAQRLTWIAWPAFLVAAVMEMLVFAMVDPSELHWQGVPLDWSRQTVYTVSFFFFWFSAMASSALTCLLALSPFEVNRCPVPLSDRPQDCAKIDHGHSCC